MLCIDDVSGPSTDSKDIWCTSEVSEYSDYEPHEARPKPE